MAEFYLMIMSHL